MSSKIIVPLQNYKETIGYQNFSRFFMVKNDILSLSVAERCFFESTWRAQAVVIPLLVVYLSVGMFVPSLNEKNGDIKFGISEHVFLVFFSFFEKGTLRAANVEKLPLHVDSPYTSPRLPCFCHVILYIPSFPSLCSLV